MFGNERFLKFREADTGSVGVSKLVEDIANQNPKMPPEQVVEEIQAQGKKQQDELKIKVVEETSVSLDSQAQAQVEAENQEEQAQSQPDNAAVLRDEAKVDAQTNKDVNVVQGVDLNAEEKKDLSLGEQEANEAEVENLTGPVSQVTTQNITEHPKDEQKLNNGNAEDVKTQVAPPLPPRKNLKADAMNEAKKNMSAQQASVSAKMNGGQAAAQSLSQSFTLPKLPFPSWVRNGVAKMMDKHPSTGGFLRNAFNSVVEAVKQKASGILRWVYRKEIETIEKHANTLSIDSPRNLIIVEKAKEFYQSDIKRGLLERSSKESDKNLLQKMKDRFGSVDQIADKFKLGSESYQDRHSSFSAK